MGYGNVGGVEEADYDNLSTAKDLTTVIDKVAPGSYRLAVSLFSMMDAVIIESCKIHGVDDAEFYEELKAKQYELTEDTQSEEPLKVDSVRTEEAKSTEKESKSENKSKPGSTDDAKDVETEEETEE